MLSSELINSQNLTYAERSSQLAVQPEPSVSTRKYVRCRCDSRSNFSYHALLSTCCSHFHDCRRRYRRLFRSIAHQRDRFVDGDVFRWSVFELPSISYRAKSTQELP